MQHMTGRHRDPMKGKPKCYTQSLYYIIIIIIKYDRYIMSCDPIAFLIQRPQQQLYTQQLKGKCPQQI